jgi:hypothetical protein
MLLVPFVLAILILGGLALGLLHEGFANRDATQLQENRVRALHIAQMGMLRSQMEIQGGQDLGGDGLGTLSGTYGGGTYQVTATQDAGDTTLWRLFATGAHGGAVRRVESGLRLSTGGLFKYMLFGKDRVEITSGSYTDGYDSRLGSYSGQPHTHTGHVGSNGQIWVDSGSEVRGDAVPGPFAVTVITSGSDVSGDTTPRSEDMDVPDPTYADFEQAYLSNDNHKLPTGHSAFDYDPATYRLKIDSGTHTFPAGIYFFSDLYLEDGSTIHVSGPVVVYVTGDFVVNSGTYVNRNNAPGEFLVYAHPYALPPGFDPGTDELKIESGSGSGLALYAPARDVLVLSGTDVFGAIVGLTVVVDSGSFFHWDEALGDLGGGGGAAVPEVLYWLERSPPLR